MSINDTGDEQMQAYCANNIYDGNCNQWYLDGRYPERRIYKDRAMTDYCLKNVAASLQPNGPPSDPVCGCYHSAANFLNQMNLPQCFDKRCAKNPAAYMPLNMQHTRCPDEMACDQYISLSDDSVKNILTNVNMVQNCQINQIQHLNLYAPTIAELKQQLELATVQEQTQKTQLEQLKSEMSTVQDTIARLRMITISNSDTQINQAIGVQQKAQQALDASNKAIEISNIKQAATEAEIKELQILSAQLQTKIDAQQAIVQHSAALTTSAINALNDQSIANRIRAEAIISLAEAVDAAKAHSPFAVLLAKKANDAIDRAKLSQEYADKAHAYVTFLTSINPDYTEGKGYFIWFILFILLILLVYYSRVLYALFAKEQQQPKQQSE